MLAYIGMPVGASDMPISVIEIDTERRLLFCWSIDDLIKSIKIYYPIHRILCGFDEAKNVYFQIDCFELKFKTLNQGADQARLIL